MAHDPESGETSVVSMAEYGERAKRITGNTGAIADELKKSRQAVSLRLIAKAESKKSNPHLTVVSIDEDAAEKD